MEHLARTLHHNASRSSIKGNKLQRAAMEVIVAKTGYLKVVHMDRIVGLPP